MPTPPVIPRPTVLAGIARTLRRPIASFDDYFRRFGANFILAVGGSRRTHMTIDADVFQHVLQKNHRNYEKSEIQTTQMARYFGFGLLTNSGQSWLTQRRLIQPGFHRKRLANLTTEMQSVIRNQVDQLATVAERGGKINLHHFTRDTVFRIIVRAIFTDGFGPEESKWLNQAMDKIQAYIIYPVRVPFLRAPLRWLGLERKHVGITEEIRQHVQQKINVRRSGSPQDDLLQMLLDSRYEDTGEPMSDKQLIDEIMILFAAGHETSANSLAWTIWLLLQHPEELAKVRAEIETASSAGPIDFEGVRRLPYLMQVIEESLRLYPSAWITDRVALGKDEAATYDIEKGTVIGLYIYGLHRNSAYWDAPTEFRPERMAPAAKKARHPMSFLPFGGGPRLCIGNHFAMLEMQLLLVELLSRFDFQLPATADQIGVKPLVTLHMDKAVWLGVSAIES